MLTSEQLAIIRRNSWDEEAFQQILAVLKSSEWEERQSRWEMFEAVFSFIPIGITVHKPDGTLLAFNESARRILHIPPDRPEELDPRLSTWRTVNPDGSPVNLEDFPAAQALRTGELQGGELFKAHLIDGETIWVESYAAPLYRRGETEPYGVVASLIDVTRWREAEAAVREQETLLLQLADHIQEVFYVRDGELGQWLYINQAYEAIWGRPVSELLAEPNSFRRYIHPDDLESYYQTRQKYREQDVPAHINYRIIRDDGEVRWIETRDFPIRDEQGNTIYIGGIAEDVTTQVAYEQLLRQMNDELEERVAERTLALEAANAQLVELSAVKNQFVSNISHELKTPLTNFLLYLKLLAKRPEKQEKYLNVLEREAERLRTIVENLLSISLLDYETIELKRELVVVDQFVSEFVDDRRALALDKNIRVCFYAGSQLALSTMVDRRLLMQALGCLFTNAVNYTPENGSITVVVQPKKKQEIGGVSITFSDTGYGFTAEEEEHLFDRFYRGEAARLSQLPGTGLGLEIAQQIVQRQGGEVTASSAGLEQGAMFEIWLPVRTELSLA